MPGLMTASPKCSRLNSFAARSMSNVIATILPQLMRTTGRRRREGRGRWTRRAGGAEGAVGDMQKGKLMWPQSAAQSVWRGMDGVPGQMPHIQPKQEQSKCMEWVHEAHAVDIP
eukprot:364175-Chlamydomonas_euryale.AAC.12